MVQKKKKIRHCCNPKNWTYNYFKNKALDIQDARFFLKKK